MHSSDGSGGDVPVLKSGTDRDTYTVASWSRANDLVFNVLSKNNPGGDLWTLSMVGDRTPKAYVNSKSREAHGTFSPDGRWVAYNRTHRAVPKLSFDHSRARTPRNRFRGTAGRIRVGVETEKSFSFCRERGR